LGDDELGDMTELMLTHSMPASNAFVAPNCTGVATATRSNEVLQNEIFPNHSRPVPDKLVHVQWWRGYTLREARVRTLSVSLLSSKQIT
jgi:hypothetical protein